MKWSWIAAASLAVATVVAAQSARSQGAGFVPENGFVPDAATARRIAEAVWIPIYGEKQVASERPFKASLHGDVWIVTGTLPAHRHGGVAEADISKRDGRILRVIHGK